MEGVSVRLLADILAARRESFNARFAAARAGCPLRNPGGFADHLRGPFLRLFAALAAAAGPGAAADPARLPPVVDALYDASLDLYRAGLLSASPAAALVRRVWEELLPAVPALVAAQPRPACAALCNAAGNLARRAPEAAGRWTAAMRDALRAGGACCRDAAALRNLALVLAWRSGLPQYRDGAIRCWRDLPEPLWPLSLGLPAGSPLPADAADRMRNPWWNPAGGGSGEGGKPILAARCGGFRGFGGPFRRPPLAAARDGRLAASDGEEQWEIHADRFGTALLPFRPPATGAKTGGSFQLASDGTVTRGAAETPFPQLAGWSSWAADQWTLAVTLPDSHFVFLVGAQ